MTDRRYTYLAKTFDSPLDPACFVDRMRTSVLPAWRALCEAGSLRSVEVLQKIGDIDLLTAARPVRDWSHFALLELAESADVERVIAAEADAGVSMPALAELDIEYLSNEILVRPAGAGTAIPAPFSTWPPPRQTAGIEYIEIPEARWLEYRGFMQRVMGPVGARLVELGHSARIQILECERALHRDPSLPRWNRVHVLWGEFDDPATGFFRHTTEVVRTLLGPELDMHGALAAVNAYRTKPRMSRNVLVPELCLRATDAGHAPQRSDSEVS